LLNQNSKLKETLEWMSQQKNLDHQILSRCQDALEYVENDLDPDEDDDESATDL
jgi:hypothetical protein